MLAERGMMRSDRATRVCGNVSDFRLIRSAP